ncbi:hypothetical protein E2C01_044910 [Portunus trituberculatus]|uniref:Uncharacterized protein n=1 Tax=Portunus trituberculatus TaxID=210409 RepID=A0A5B7G1E4_PORTR|nr:hypothetical protein [Portunus trituberculatus]
MRGMRGLLGSCLKACVYSAREYL